MVENQRENDDQHNRRDHFYSHARHLPSELEEACNTVTHHVVIYSR